MLCAVCAYLRSHECNIITIIIQCVECVVCVICVVCTVVSESRSRES